MRPETLVRICDECNFGTYGGRCIICGSPGACIALSGIPIYAIIRYVLGISDAYYCAECTRLEKDRDGCPKIVNLGASRTDLFYERRRLGWLPLALSFSLHTQDRPQFQDSRKVEGRNKWLLTRSDTSSSG